MDLAKQILNQHPPRSYKSPCGIEVLMSVSREWASTHFADTGQWARLSKEWLETTFGKDSVLSCALHLDETRRTCTPIVMPVVDKHIDVRPWMDGPDKLSDLQSSYAKAVEDLGLVRGIPNTQTKHTTIQGVYQALERDFSAEMPAPKENETAADYQKRLEPIWKAMAARAVTADRNKARADELEKLITGGRVTAVEQERSRSPETTTKLDISQDISF